MHYVLALLSVVLLAVTSPAPSLTGTWQGTMSGPGERIRRIMVITKAGGTYDVVIHSVDETDVPIVTHSVTVHGSNVTMTFDMNTAPWMDYHRTYKANVVADGTTIEGTWSGPDVPAVAMKYTRVAHAMWPVVTPKSQFVDVAPGVKDEVLDWGGSGRPILLLAGLGNTGHDFYKIVPDLTKHYRVYSMTRRGFGTSSKPPATAANYSADRLGDDVLAVIDALHLDKPVLIGHSIAGEELSDIGTRYPGKVSALVYLDAGYWYAFAGPQKPNVPTGKGPLLLGAFLGGEKKFTGPIDVPILAIFAAPGNTQGLPKSERTPEKIKKSNAEQAAQIDAFAKGLPTAKVIRIPHADHFIYISNTDEVLRDINAFIGSLPQ